MYLSGFVVCDENTSHREFQLSTIPLPVDMAKINISYAILYRNIYWTDFFAVLLGTILIFFSEFFL